MPTDPLPPLPLSPLPPLPTSFHNFCPINWSLYIHIYSYVYYCKEVLNKKQGGREYPNPSTTKKLGLAW